MVRQRTAVPNKKPPTFEGDWQFMNENWRNEPSGKQLYEQIVDQFGEIAAGAPIGFGQNFQQLVPIGRWKKHLRHVQLSGEFFNKDGQNQSQTHGRRELYFAGDVSNFLLFDSSGKEGISLLNADADIRAFSLLSPRQTGTSDFYLFSEEIASEASSGVDQLRVINLSKLTSDTLTLADWRILDWSVNEQAAQVIVLYADSADGSSFTTQVYDLNRGQNRELILRRNDES